MTHSEYLNETMLNKNYSLVCFVGSGLSQNHIDWLEFIRELALYHNKDNIVSRIDQHKELPEGVSFDIKSILRDADECVYCFTDELELRAFMSRLFGSNEKDTPPEVFSSLARSTFKFFLTTNYDTNIETAYKANNGVELKIVRANDPLKALEYLAQGIPFVFKIHGCANTGGPFVIGNESYKTVIHDNKYMEFVLDAIFAAYPIIFLGFGFNDPHILNYLETHKSTLQEKACVPKFSFVKKSEVDDNIRAYRKDFGIKAIEVEYWSELENLFEQYSFMQIMDSYSKVRLEYSWYYKQVVNSINRQALWGALIYCVASIDIGRTEVCLKLIDVVTKNVSLNDYINRFPPLRLIYFIISGQVNKLMAKYDEAARCFKNVQSICIDNNTIIPPLRSLGFRYVAVFIYQHQDQAGELFQLRPNELLKRAEEILGGHYPGQALDVQKWLAAIDPDKEVALESLRKLAEKSARLGFLKTEAWCKYNSILISKELQDRKDTENITEIERVIDIFLDMEHYVGLYYSYLLLAELMKKTDIPREKLVSIVERTKALMIIAGEKRFNDKLNAILQETGKQ